METGAFRATLSLAGGDTIRSGEVRLKSPPRPPTGGEREFWEAVESVPAPGSPGFAFLRLAQAEAAAASAPGGWPRRWAARILASRLVAEVYRLLESGGPEGLEALARAGALAREGSAGEPDCLCDLHDGDAALFAVFYATEQLDPTRSWLAEDLPRRALWMRYLEP